MGFKDFILGVCCGGLFICILALLIVSGTIEEYDVYFESVCEEYDLDYNSFDLISNKPMCINSSIPMGIIQKDYIILNHNFEDSN